MRLRTSDLTRRVNADLTLRFNQKGLTSFAGLEFVRRYFSLIDLRRQMRRVLYRALPKTDFGASGMTLLMLVLIITGGRRIRHLRYLEQDPLVLRCCGLRRLPAPYSLSRWLSRFDADSLSALSTWNERIVGDAIHSAGLRRLTIDVDGSVISTGLTVEGAKRGFNPHHRKNPSYYPITAYEANTSQILRIENRAGNVHDGKAAVTFLDELAEQLNRAGLGGYAWEFRMDGAFFRYDILDRLESMKAEFAIKVPFYRWLDLQSVIKARSRWHRVDDRVSYFETDFFVEAWNWTLPVTIYRKQTFHETRKNYQLDLFDPDDGYYEYSAIVSNKPVNGATLWYFQCGRGAHEKAYADLKTGFAFASVPSRSYHANSAWQVFSVMAFNLMRGYQRATGAVPRSQNRKRRSRWRFQTIQSLRFTCLNRAGIVTKPQGRAMLDVGSAESIRRQFQKTDQMLQNAA